jgi:probable HAF family extracellular repeat protein
LSIVFTSPGILTFTFHSPIRKFGIYIGGLGSILPGGSDFSISNSNGFSSVLFPHHSSTSNDFNLFAGLISDSPFTSVSLMGTELGDAIFLDDLYYGQPGSRTPSTFSLTDLGIETEAFAINNSGKVVGDKSVPYRVPVIWNGGVATDLGVLNGMPSGIAYSINNSGKAVGHLSGVPSILRAIMWNGTVPTDLGSLSGMPATTANGINGRGQVVGFSAASCCVPGHATLWNRGNITDLGTLPGGSISNAYAINDIGQIVGNSNTSSGLFHATLWKGTTPSDLGSLGGNGSFSIASDINNTGLVVGFSYIGGSARATLWNIKTNSMTDLGTLPGGAVSFARGINQRGQIVGGSYTTSAGAQHATIWDSGVLIDLNTLLDSTAIGWILQDATGINNAGQIVGNALFNGQHHAYLLTPCPSCTVVPTLPP